MTLWALVALDVNAGFLTRLAFLFASAWYIGRWITPLNEVYALAGALPGMTLELFLLIVAPVGVLAVSVAGPTAHAWKRYKNRD